VNAPPGWLQVVAAAYDAGEDAWASDHVTVCRVRGGANNALYQVEVDGQCYACKLCVADGRQRAAREHGTLRLLHASGLDIAPEPLWLDEGCAILPFPTVVYRWLHGTSLSGSLTAEQLAALLDTYQRLHSLQSGDSEDLADRGLPHAFFHWFDFAPYLADLRGMLHEYAPWLATTAPDGQDLQRRLLRLVDSCAQTIMATDVDPSYHRFPLSLCRVDPNLANVVWDRDGRPRWVDWEGGGWGDPALDLADLRWHASLADLNDAQHAWLREIYLQPVGDHDFEARITVWDRILATRWPLLILRRLWSVYNGPDRLRLTRFDADPDELRARLVRFIERAEHFAQG
jgi:hypothetical protein